MDIKKPQLVKVVAFAVFLEIVLQHPLATTVHKLSALGVLQHPQI